MLKIGRSQSHQIEKGVIGMNISKKAALAIAAIGAIGAVNATPANAAVMLCENANCVSTDANVLVNSGSGPIITGNYNTSDGVEVTFTSSTDTTLVGGANGQASVGSLDNLLNQLTFSIANGFGFRTAIFNLSPVSGNANNEAVSVVISYLKADGTLGSKIVSTNTNGQNFFGLYGTEGEVFTSAGFTGNPSTNGISELKQLRLGGVAALAGAVPEPTTWMMMLFGMGIIGFSLRRKNKAAAKISFA